MLKSFITTLVLCSSLLVFYSYQKKQQAEETTNKTTSSLPTAQNNTNVTMYNVTLQEVTDTPGTGWRLQSPQVSFSSQLKIIECTDATYTLLTQDKEGTSKPAQNTHPLFTITAQQSTFDVQRKRMVLRGGVHSLFSRNTAGDKSPYRSRS